MQKDMGQGGLGRRTLLRSAAAGLAVTTTAARAHALAPAVTVRRAGAARPLTPTFFGVNGNNTRGRAGLGPGGPGHGAREPATRDHPLPGGHDRQLLGLAQGLVPAERTLAGTDRWWAGDRPLRQLADPVRRRLEPVRRRTHVHAEPAHDRRSRRLGRRQSTHAAGPDPVPPPGRVLGHPGYADRAGQRVLPERDERPGLHPAVPDRRRLRGRGHLVGERPPQRASPPRRSPRSRRTRRARTRPDERAGTRGCSPRCPASTQSRCTPTSTSSHQTRLPLLSRSSRCRTRGRGVWPPRSSSSWPGGAWACGSPSST